MTGDYQPGGTDVAIADGGTGQSTAVLGFNALSPLTTRGDIIYRDATNNARLAKGTAGNFLQIGANDPIWAPLNHGFFSVHRNSVNQSASAGAYSKVQFTTEIADVNSYFDNATNFRFQPTVAGKYFFIFYAKASFGSVSNDVVHTRISKFGSSTVEFYGTLVSGGAATSGASCVSAVIPLNGSSDYVEAYCYPTASGATPAISGTPWDTWFMGWKIGE